MEVNNTVIVSVRREADEDATNFADMSFQFGTVTRVYKNGSFRVFCAKQNAKYLFKTDTLHIDGWHYKVMTRHTVRLYALAALYTQIDHHPPLQPCGKPYMASATFRAHTIVHRMQPKPLGEFTLFDFGFYPVSLRGYQVLTYLLIAVKPIDETTYMVLDSFHPEAQSVTAPNYELAVAHYLAQFPI
jgi:hypothetical protein